MIGKKKITSIATSIALVLQMVFVMSIAGTNNVYGASGTKLKILDEKSALTVNITSTDRGIHNWYGMNNDFIDNLFDGYTGTIAEFLDTNEAYIQAHFQKSRKISTIRAYLGKNQTQTWSIEAANTQYDMDNKLGSYQLIMPESAPISSQGWVEYQLSSSSSKTIWKINVRNTSGTNSVYLSEFEFWGTDSRNPTTPDNLTATTVDARTVSLKWTASDDDIDVVGYKVLRNGVEIGRTTVNTYTDTLLNPNTKYTYQVKAFDPAGKESSLSSQVSATTSNTMNFKSEYKALLLIYDPIIKKGAYVYEKDGVSKVYVVKQDTKYSQLFNDKTKLDYIYNFVENLKSASGGSINYTIIPKYINDYVPYNSPKDPEIISADNIIQFGMTGYLNPKYRDPGARHHSGANYHKILKDNDVLSLVENGEIDSVWIASSYDHFGFYEAVMAGKDAFNINGIERKIDCSKKFDILAYPGLECFGHMLENFMGRANDSLPRKWTYNVWNTFNVNDPNRTQVSKTLNDWEKFMLTDSVNYGGNANSSTGNAQVGNMHFPPHAYKNYSWNDYVEEFNSIDTITAYGGSWKLENSQLKVEGSPDAKIIVHEWNDKNLQYQVSDGSFEADVMVSSSNSSADAGIIFRASKISTGAEALTSYYASINPYTDKVSFGLFYNGYTLLKSASMTLNTNTYYKLRVVADGKSFKVYVNDMNTPKLTFEDTGLKTGAFGLYARNTQARFDNFVVKPWTKSYADNWYNYPNISDTNPRVINNDEWNGDQDTFQMWVLDRVPRNPGTHSEATGNYLNNWWAYMDFNRFDGKPITWTMNSNSFPVPPVYNLEVVHSYNTLVYLKWSTPQNSGITGYNIYRDGVKVKTITNASSTTFGEVGLQPYRNYTYTIKAFNASGKESVERTVNVYVTAN